MRKRVTYVLILLMSINCLMCSAEVTGCSKREGNYNSYYSVQLSCGGYNYCSYNSACRYHRYYCSYYDTYYSSSCLCYRDIFENGYYTNVEELKPCLGSQLDASLPGKFISVEKYDISSTGIVVLTSNDLNFASLKKLDARNNKLTKISGSIFIYPELLEDIDFSNNEIDHLYENDFSGASKLSTIKIANNKISTLDKGIFSDLTQLTYVDLSGNFIESINVEMFQNNKNLRTLNLNGNPIQRIDNNIVVPLSGSASVEVSCDNFIEFDSSHLARGITFDNDNVKVSGLSDCRIIFKNLKYFNISGNHLQNTVEVIKHLGSPIETLDASSNFIGKLTAKIFEKFVNLKYLNLISTNLTTIDSDTFNSSKLSIIDFSYNNISTLNEGTFNNTPDLIEINFSHNEINELYQGVFEGASMLTIINFSYNNISVLHEEVFIHTPDLTMIDLSHNKLNELRQNDFIGAWNLTKVNLSYNNISIIDSGIFTNAPDLTSINLSNNEIFSLDKEIFSDLIEMTHLDLSSNSIESIDEDMFQNNTKLQQLYLGNNPLYRIDENILMPMSNGASIRITFSNIREFDSTSLKENIRFSEGFEVKTTNGSYSEFYDLHFLTVLKYLNISGNHLQNTLEVIRHLGSSIETLDASSNFIGNLTAKTFEKFVNLKYLNLISTNLTTIDSDTFNPLLFPEANRKLELLLLNDNPIKRLDSNVFLPMMNLLKVEVKVSCDYVEEIGTNSIENELNIDLNEEEGVVFCVKSRNFELACTKERFKQLTSFNISGNQLENGPKIIEWLGNSVKTLDVSSNYIGKLNMHTFEKFTNLQYLNLSRTNLSNFGFNTFYHQKKLRALDLSFNRLKKVNFTLLFRHFQFLNTLHLEGNDLIELNSVNQAIFPSLSSLCISKNHFSCDYLATFLPQRHYELIIPPEVIGYNIDGVDCIHEGEEISPNGKVEIVTKKEISGNVPKVNVNFDEDNSTNLQRTSETNKLTTFDIIDQTTKIEDKPTTRFDCPVFSPNMNSEKVQVSCDYIEEIDTSCMGNSILINMNNGDEIVFHLSQINSEFHCTKDHFQKIKYLNVSGNQLQNASQVISMLGAAIETLDLSSNFIGTPNAQTFKKFTNLKYLNLSHTNLSNFAYATFFNQQKLQVLDLSFNRLGKVDFTKFLRNFRDLNTLNLEGNDLMEINSITRVIFPRLFSLGISKNRFSCDYLATFLLRWDNLQLLKNPSDETHIDGVDCQEDVQSTKKSVEISIRERSGLVSSKFNLTNEKDSKGSEEHSKFVVNYGSDSMSADIRVQKNLFLVLILLCCGYLVVKSKIIQRIRQRIARKTLKNTVDQQYPENNIHASVIELTKREHVHE